MHRAPHGLYSELSFAEHSIPDVSATAYSGGKVYYHHQAHIHSYDMASKTHTKLYQVPNCSELFMVKNVLCAVYANFLKVFEKEPRELRLREIPRKIVRSNDGAQNRDGVGFVYDDAIEIFTLTRYPIKTIDAPPDLGIVDFANVEDTTYILSKQGRVFRAKNIFLTHQLASVVPLVAIPEPPSPCSSIFSYNGGILLAGRLDGSATKNSWIEKYEIGDNSLAREYSFSFQSHRSTAVRSGFLLGEATVHLARAPILVIDDQLYNIFHFNSDSLLGLSAGRLYFMEDAPRVSSSRLSYELSSHSFTINPNSIAVPDFIKDPQQTDHFLRNETLLAKYEMVLAKIQDIGRDLARRERELEAQRTELSAAIEKVEEKKRNVEERIQGLVGRARNARARGDLGGFYRKVGILEKRLEQTSPKGLSELAEKLRAQRAVLRGKTH